MAHGESNYAMFTGVLKNYMEIRQDGEIAVMNQFLSQLLVCSENLVYEKLDELAGRFCRRKRSTNME